MFTFSRKSKKILSSAHPDLQKLFNEVIKKCDCSVISGHRGAIEQNVLFSKGFSKLKFPESKHNALPSQAVDVVPYPIDWKDIERFKEFVGIVQETADELSIKIICGASWVRFKDYPHFQLAGGK